jgi:hypothetical protein
LSYRPSGKRGVRHQSSKKGARNLVERVVSASMSDVRSLIEEFSNQLAALVENQALAQARAAVDNALGGGRRSGRPPKLAPLTIGAKARKKPPKQFCPVPGCKNAAAPVFGMVCSEHKDVAKAKIKKYREARKAKKLGLKAPKALKRTTPKNSAKRRKVVKVRKMRKRAATRPAPVAANSPAAAAA